MKREVGEQRMMGLLERAHAFFGFFVLQIPDRSHEISLCNETNQAKDLSQATHLKRLEAIGCQRDLHRRTRPHQFVKVLGKRAIALNKAQLGSAL